MEEIFGLKNEKNEKKGEVIEAYTRKKLTIEEARAGLPPEPDPVTGAAPL